MEVLGLWRHAVKSLQGERLESARFEDDGQGLAGRRMGRQDPVDRGRSCWCPLIRASAALW